MNSNTNATTSFPALAIRHGLGVLAGFLITRGIAADATSSASLLAGVLTLLFVTVVSWLFKVRWNTSPAFNRFTDDNAKQLLQKLFGAVVSQALAAFSGYLATTPEGTFNVQDPEALALFFTNAAASRFKLHQLATGLPRAALMLAACASLASCLSTASRDTLKHELETAFIDAGKAFTASSLRATLKTLEAEREAIEAAPVPLTWQEQVVQQNKLAAIKAAISLAQERLNKLTAPSSKAVNNVNPVNEVKQAERSAFQVSSFKFNPLRGHSNGTTQSMPFHARAVKVLRVSVPPLSTPRGGERPPSKGQVARAHLSAGRPASSATPPHATSSARATRSRPAVPIYAPRIIAALRATS